MAKNSLLGIIITFNPPSNFLNNLTTLSKQLEKMLIIDNASDVSFHKLIKNKLNDKDLSLDIIFNESNLGIATALNQGFAWAIEQRYDYVVIFDQDSYPSPAMIQKMLFVYNSQPDYEKIAIVAPNVKDSKDNIYTHYLRQRNGVFFKRTPCKPGQDAIDDVSLVITSGSLNRLSAYHKIGKFREDFFIDYVDIEYCLRAKKLGYHITVACDAFLYHHLGNQQTKKLGPFRLHPTFHSPIRWYYINRNRIIMYRLYAVRYPYWALYDFMSGCYLLIRMFLFEDQKSKKMLALLLGITDGIFRRMGRISLNREKQILGKNI